MALDGSLIRALVFELNNEITGGRIVKIVQTEKYELLLTIKKDGLQKRLLISVNPSLPLVYLTETNKVAPLTAPPFSMLLRKHIQNGLITGISQPSLERIINIDIEHYNEMGDLCSKTLTIELMGKHSNIIFRDKELIIDSIRHISSLVSSVREVLPGREYFIPFEGDKLNPFTSLKQDFFDKIFSKGALPVSKAIYTSITGFSPDISEEILYRAKADSETGSQSIPDDKKECIYDSFLFVKDILKNNSYYPNIVYENNEPVFFGTFKYEIYNSSRYEIRHFENISSLLTAYYSQKQAVSMNRQKTSELRLITGNLLAKDYKKYDLQLKQLKDTEKMAKYRLYGDLLTAYGYQSETNSNAFKTTDFYTGEEITIPLDPTKSAIENGKNYYNKYSKLKRTKEALEEIIKETEEEISHLESIQNSLDMVRDEADIKEIKSEMISSGYIKGQSAKAPKGKKSNSPAKGDKAIKSSPLHFITEDGFHIYVGKNNFQNENLSLKTADKNDWWFHAKSIPGSHVILKCDGKKPSDLAFNNAASLAAHYSKAGDSVKAEVDYTLIRNLKKPAKAKPGFVIYHTNYSITADTDISKIKEIN